MNRKRILVVALGLLLSGLLLAQAGFANPLFCCSRQCVSECRNQIRPCLDAGGSPGDCFDEFFICKHRSCGCPLEI